MAEWSQAQGRVSDQPSGSCLVSGRAGMGAGGLGSPLGWTIPHTVTRIGQPGCLRPGFKSWVRIKSQAPTCWTEDAQQCVLWRGA